MSYAAGSGRPNARFHTSRAKLQAYDGALFVLLVGLSAVTLISISPAGFATSVHSSNLSAAITCAALLVALGAASVALGEFILYGRVSSLYVSLAFVIFAASEVGLGLLPLLSVQDVAGRAPYGLAVLRIAGGIFLVAASMQLGGIIPAYRRARLSIAGLLVALGLSFVVSFEMHAGGSAPLQTATKSALELGSALLFAVASGLFWRATRAPQMPNRVWLLWLSMSLAIATFSQIQFAVHGPKIGVVQAGDILWLVFFTGILLALAVEWTQNYWHLRWQARELEALHALMRAPVIENVPELVDHIVGVVSGTFGMETRLVLTGRDVAAAREDDAIDMEQRSSPAIPDWKWPSSRPDGEIGGWTVLRVPVGSRAQHLGVLTVFGGAGAEFTAQDVSLLRAFGAQATVLLDRAFLYEEVAAGAVLQERSRLAREIHDGLAQHLAFLKMRVAWLKRSPASVGFEQLGDIEAVLETALIEARYAITTLRAQPEGTSTMDAITDYAREFGQVSGMAVEVATPGVLPDVGPKVRVELLRVVQEALNNVRKHAQADAVRLRIGARDDGVEVTIEDNGTGFDANRGLEGHFGLEIMRERSESVGGTIRIESVAGSGTCIAIWVPGSESKARGRKAAV